MADIVLRDRSGNPVEYPGIEKIKLNTTGGETVEFVDPALIPESVEKTIDPDFSGGNIVETPEAGTMFSKVIVNKPATLDPKYIAEGVNVAGIVGTLSAGGGSNVLIKPYTCYAGMTGVATLVTADELSTIGFDTSGKCFIGIIDPYGQYGYLSSPGSISHLIAFNYETGSGYYGTYMYTYKASSRTQYGTDVIYSNPFSGSMVSNTPYYAGGEIRYNHDSSKKLWTRTSDSYNRTVYVIAGNLTPTI